ncbi:MAG: 16S rRNA processing protein RimM [Selenomonadaceae bacterium]|nr:16S rRNA processing protein RimM [Selenomonadaceae bacterium]
MNDKVIIGRLGAARGLNGEIKISPLTDFENRFDNLTEVEIDGKILKINYVKHIGNNLVVNFENINNREEAQKLTGKLLKVDKKNAAPLAEGEFYTFDLIGIQVFDTDENKLGKITNVLKTGSNDVFVATCEDERELLIPALKRVVKTIDIDNKIMIIDMKMMEEC